MRFKKRVFSLHIIRLLELGDQCDHKRAAINKPATPAPTATLPASLPEMVAIVWVLVEDWTVDCVETGA